MTVSGSSGKVLVNKEASLSTYTDVVITPGATETYKVRMSSTQGVAMWRDDVKQTQQDPADLADLTLALTEVFLGSESGAYAASNSNLKDFRTIQGDLTDQEVIDL